MSEQTDRKDIDDVQYENNELDQKSIEKVGIEYKSEEEEETEVQSREEYWTSIGLWVLFAALTAAYPFNINVVISKGYADLELVDVIRIVGLEVSCIRILTRQMKASAKTVPAIIVFHVLVGLQSVLISFLNLP